MHNRINDDFQLDMFLSTEDLKITKPIRLIELFGGYGSQALALKYLGVDFDREKLLDFYQKWVESYILLQQQWQSGTDDTHYWKMEHDLKLDGITYDEFDKILTEIGDKYGV